MSNSEENGKNSDQNAFNLSQIFNKPSSDLLSSLSGKVTEIIQNVIDHLKAGLKADLKASKVTIGLLGAGIISGFVTLVLLFVTAIFALARVIPGWLAGLIVSCFTGTIAAITFTTGWKKRARDPFTGVKEALNTRNAFSSENKEIRKAA